MVTRLEDFPYIHVKVPRCGHENSCKKYDSTVLNACQNEIGGVFYLFCAGILLMKNDDIFAGMCYDNSEQAKLSAACTLRQQLISLCGPAHYKTPCLTEENKNESGEIK